MSSALFWSPVLDVIEAKLQLVRDVARVGNGIRGNVKAPIKGCRILVIGDGLTRVGLYAVGVELGREVDCTWLADRDGPTDPGSPTSIKEGAALGERDDGSATELLGKSLHQVVRELSFRQKAPEFVEENNVVQTELRVDLCTQVFSSATLRNSARGCGSYPGSVPIRADQDVAHVGSAIGKIGLDPLPAVLGHNLV